MFSVQRTFLISQGPQNFGYLTSPQALADFVDVINFLKYDKLKLQRNKDDVPVIAFGGSYGGMLAAWMRMIHPAVIHGYVMRVYWITELADCRLLCVQLSVFASPKSALHQAFALSFIVHECR